MCDDPLPTVESTAIEACLAGGTYLRSAFRADDTEAERLEHDVKSSADVESEERMLGVIRAAFPDHRVYAEESGDHGGSGEYRWIVDPLDGTNDFESGLPSFATAATVLRNGRSEVAATSVPLLGDLYVSRRDDGVRYNGRRVRGGSDAPPRKSIPQALDPESSHSTHLPCCS